MPKELVIQNVAEALAKEKLQNPNLPFLNLEPDHTHIWMIQPTGIVVAEPNYVGPEERPAATMQMRKFITLANNTGAHVIASPEYSCTRDALLETLEENIRPGLGALWALACESATPDQLENFIAALQKHATVIFDETVLEEIGNFVNPLCYVFRTLREHNQEALVVLIQTKTEQMGGKDHFEYSNLKVGHKLYRFKTSINTSTQLVSLLCSDSLNPQLEDHYSELRRQTLILHLQLNLHPENESFRAYRAICCTWAPRSTEILCLNWASGTILKTAGQPDAAIDDPRTTLFRGLDELMDTDARISENHSKGCYLTTWKSFHSSAFVFAPGSYVFHFETTKPWVEGVGTNVSRTGPRMLSVNHWDATISQWTPLPHAVSDGFSKYWSDPYPDLSGILMPLYPQVMDIERLIHLSLGYAAREKWSSWKELPSFELESDETSCRLTVCVPDCGKGKTFREKCLSQFRAFIVRTLKPAAFSARLAGFRNGGFQVRHLTTFKPKSMHNLHMPDGTSATAIYVGEFPSAARKDEVKKRTQKVLREIGGDPELLAIWYSEGVSTFDFMDAEIPTITDDPGAGSVDIDNTRA